MATFHFEGMDDMLKYLKRTHNLTGQMAEEMVDAGVPILIDTWRGVITARKHIDQHEMIEKVGEIKPKKDAEYVYRDVYPKGKDKKGVRNAEKAFLLHYGWKSNNTKSGPHDGDHFVDEIEREATPKVVAAMEEVLNKYMNEKG